MKSQNAYILKFIIRSVLVLLFALLTVVGIYVFIQYYSATPHTQQSLYVVSGQTHISSSTSAQSGTTTFPDIPATGLPLKDLSLSEQQRATLVSAGIDVDSFVITQSMLNCAKTHVGVDRVAQIVSGSAVRLFETVALTTCLRQ